MTSPPFLSQKETNAEKYNNVAEVGKVISKYSKTGDPNFFFITLKPRVE